MRSELHPTPPPCNPVIEGVIRVVSDIAGVFLLLGELLTPRTRTRRKTDHAEPPDALEAALAA